MSFGITELLLILGIVALLFGTSRLRTIGGDLGQAIRGFRSAIQEDKGEKNADERVIEGEAEKTETR